jgi:uncharacterized protein involved in exopolysaccharide biosynthesis
MQETKANSIAQRADDDEIVIDLVKIARWLGALIWQNKVLLGALAVIGALLGLAYTYISPIPYEAVANIAMIKSRTDVQFDSRIKTISPDLASAAQAATDARKASLLTLALNGNIAQNVIQKMGERLPVEDRNAARLLSRVKAEIPNKADLISIKVQHAQPDVAATIANAWANEYERYVNAIYGTTSGDDVTGALQTELDRTRKDSDAAQIALEKFIADNKADELSRVIRDSQLLIDARAMRDQIAQGGEAAAQSNALALVAFKAQVNGATLPSLQLQTIPTTTAAAQMADLDGLIKSLETELVTLGKPAPAQLSALQQQIRVAQAQLEQTQTQKQQLVQARDLLRSTYNTLLSKQAEVQVSNAVSGSEVRVVSSAVVPTTRTSTGLMIILAGAAFGLILALVVAARRMARR